MHGSVPLGSRRLWAAQQELSVEIFDSGNHDVDIEAAFDPFARIFNDCRSQAGIRGERMNGVRQLSRIAGGNEHAAKR
jgi:hypothetical protein